MNEKVSQVITLLFRDTQPSEEVQALHDEVLNNCQDRFDDLIRSGLSEEEALAAVMESLKGMEDVLKEYPRREEIDYAELNLDGAEEAKAEEAPPKGPTLSHFAPEDVKTIEAALTSCDVDVMVSEDDSFSLEIIGEVHSLLEEDGTLKLWQERPAENLFKGIAWEKSFDSFESFGDAMSKLGQNISQLVNRSLKMSVSENRGLKMSLAENRATLRLPRSLHPEVLIRTTSGDIHWQDAVPGQTFTLGSTSGDINVSLDNSFLLPGVEISTTSGDVELRLSAEAIHVNTVSGDLSWEGEAQVLEMNSTSGDVDAICQAQEIKMNSTSGDLEIELLEQGPAEIRMNTVSGDVSLRLPKSVREIAATLNSSGNLRTRGVDIVDDAPVRVEAHTVSGDMKIFN